MWVAAKEKYIFHTKNVRIFPFVLLLMAGCAFMPPEIEIQNDLNLAARTENAKVIVITEKEPTFAYKVACTASIKDRSSRLNLASYSEEAKEVARRCGTEYAMVTEMSSSRIGNEVYSNATVKAIVKTGPASLTALYAEKNPDFFKKLATAAQLGNVKNLKLLLEKSGAAKQASNRSPYDTNLLNELVRMTLSRGKRCSSEALLLLIKDYQAKITTLIDTKINFDDPLECPSKFVGRSFQDWKDKPANIIKINNLITSKLNIGFTRHVGSITAYSNYLKLFPEIIKVVEVSCKDDETSQLCSLKPNLKKAKKLSSRIVK